MEPNARISESLVQLRPRRTALRWASLVLLTSGSSAPSGCATREPASLPPDRAETPADGAPAVHHEPEDAEIAASLAPVLREGIATIEEFFGAPFPREFELSVLPDRAAFDASLPPEWGLGETECWMVATGVADGIRLLSPRVWERDACEHDPGDAGQVSRLITHELVHVYHGQHNPSPDFMDVTGIDWFVEGLAVLVSGQLAAEHASAAREALQSGQGPSSLARAWTGRYRYGVSGSLVESVERQVGRSGLRMRLGVTSGEELLAAIGATEAGLLDRWRDGVLGHEPVRPPGQVKPP